MALTITAGESQHNSTWAGSETFTQSTATAQRFLNAHTEVSFLGMGTATAGPVHNQYALVATTTASGVEGDAVEGMEKYIMATATGRADVFIALPTAGRLPIAAAMQSNFAAIATTTASAGFEELSASATATWVFSVDGDFMHLKFMNGTWNYLGGGGATMSLAT